MRAGKLRHQVSLYSAPAANAPDALGDVSGDYVLVDGGLWVSIEPGSGREFWMAQGTRADLTHVISMRFRGDVGPRWRIVWNDGYRIRTFELGPPLVTDERFFEMVFTALEKRS